MTLLALVGPTASGKTEAGIEVAQRLGAEILSVDSMLVYRGMDVGTAKPSPLQRKRVPHHLIDLADPGHSYSVAEFQAAAADALAGIRARGATPLLVGGSGLYFRAVVDELEFPPTDPPTRAALEREADLVGAGRLHRRLQVLDPTAAERIEPENARRTIRALEVAAVTGRPFSTYSGQWDTYGPDRVRAAGIDVPSPILRARIERRVAAMFEGGFEAEVARLVADGAGPSLTASQAIGYAEFVAHLSGRMSREDAIASTIRRTRALARRQMAWFRRDPRIRWFPAGEGGAADLVEELTEYLRDE